MHLWASVVPESHVWDLHDGEGIPAGCTLASTHAPPPSTHSFTALTSSSTEVPLPPHLSLLLRSFRKIGFYVAGGVLKKSPQTSLSRSFQSQYILFVVLILFGFVF